MHTNDLDAFFHMASHGNKEAYNSLYESFVKQANKVVVSTVKRNTNFKGFPGDFCDLIDDLFFKAINEFEPEKGPFSAFANWLFDRRLKNAVLKEIIDIQNFTKTTDYEDSEYNEIENLPDTKSSSITNQITLNNFELHICSPNAHKNNYTRRRDKVLALQYAGYNMNEISKILNLPYPTVRGILEKAREDDDICNIKLDLK